LGAAVLGGRAYAIARGAKLGLTLLSLDAKTGAVARLEVPGPAEPAAGPPLAVAQAADFDGDGIPDLVAYDPRGESLFVYRGTAAAPPAFAARRAVPA